MDPLKIINIVGARPNLPKIAPLIREMQKHPNIKPILVHTGQHYDDQLSDIFFREMNIPAPDVNLGVGSGSHAAQTAEVLRGIEPVLLEYKPDIVLVVGDVNSTIAVALAASKLGIRVDPCRGGTAHLRPHDAGGDYRILTDALADYLFATEQDAWTICSKRAAPAKAFFWLGM
jgi:UDP-N-acetylglucosamine 2-epimerase (non-hydrolysing)